MTLDELSEAAANSAAVVLQKRCKIPASSPPCNHQQLQSAWNEKKEADPPGPVSRRSARTRIFD